ncbi:quinone-dependent dihydroorotate dehydrogenase [Flavobacteriales bacterium]|nr:quinone-dependent dihydroorotate dehydrogenase [Flavobacteriales bacterium]
MYKSVVRPLFFRFSPEWIHHFVTGSLKVICVIPGIKAILKSVYKIDSPKLEREVFGIKFPNPVGLAAGFDKNAEFYKELACFGFGFIEIGTVTPLGQPGNPQPRMFRLSDDGGLINRMGFNNEGVDSAVKRLKDRNPNFIIGGNIGKNTATSNENAEKDYITVFEKLHPVVDYFVVNVSCPNVKNLTKLQDTDFLIELLSKLKAFNSQQDKVKPILLKIAPDLNDSQLNETIEIVAKTEIDGIIATNTTTTRDGLSADASEIEKIGNGGLSGKPVKQRSTEVIRYLHTQSKGAFPIIGVGGIHSTEDALEKLDAGATLLQVYTGFIYEGPGLVKAINSAILNR